MSRIRRACPALSAPMETGDGLLVRLLPTGPIPLAAFIGLCEAARANGNGVIEITARGSIQVRGLDSPSALQFAAAFSALDIAIGEGVAIITDALPGDPAALVDANRLADELRRAAAAARLQLAPKASVVVDGGGSIDLDVLFADVRLRAVTPPGGPRLELALAGNALSATPLGLINVDEAIDAVLALLTRIAALGPEARGANLLPAPAHAPTKSHPRRPEAIGRHPLGDGVSALGLGLAFGHARAEALAKLAEAALSAGASWARPAPSRVLLLGPLSGAAVATVSQAAQALGFVTESGDPRRRIAACPGAPACAHGLIPARDLAAPMARSLPLEGGGIVVHVSGCAKGCAHQRPASLTIVGTAQGCGIVRDGTAQSVPSTYCALADLAGELDRIMRTARETVDA